MRETHPQRAERYHRGLIKRGLDECWGWRGRRVPSLQFFAYELVNGTVPDGFTVRTLCGSPDCTNPLHLWCRPR